MFKSYDLGQDFIDSKVKKVKSSAELLQSTTEISTPESCKVYLQVNIAGFWPKAIIPLVAQPKSAE